MQVTPTALPGVLILEPQVFDDGRGFFMESYNRRRFESVVASQPEFVQDNHSRSAKGVLRGLHYQLPPRSQAKLVRVIYGEVFDVAVDLRRSSPSFGQWTGALLSAENKKQLWIPEGFAHGFLTLSDHAEVLYKASAYYAPECERCIVWNDPGLGIEWPMAGLPALSGKDERGVLLQAAEVFA